MTHEGEYYEPFPILGTRPQQYIPWGLLMLHEGQAWKNHGQSLSQLAQRSGLSWAEALAIIEGKNWRDADHDENAAEITVKKMAMAFTTLRSQQKSNAPLTLAELQKMIGEPLWVVPLGKEPDWKPCWVICMEDYILVNSTTSESRAYILRRNEDYGKTWLAYRYKPSE